MVDKPNVPPSDARRRLSVGDRARPANGGDLGYLYSIYRFYDADGALLYLGRSDRVRQRITEVETGHPRGLPLGHDDGPKPWWREAVRIELDHLPPGTTGAEARAEERRQIEALHPLYNRDLGDDHVDRERFERAVDLAHFEVDVATGEHERHDGVIRPLGRVVVESGRAADRLQPGGADRLRTGTGATVTTGRLDPRPGRGPAPDGPAAHEAGTRHPLHRDHRWGWPFDGPGSVAGLVFVLLLLAIIVVAALVVEVRVVF